MLNYDYAHRNGVEPIAWQDFGRLGKDLAQRLAVFQPQVSWGWRAAAFLPPFWSPLRRSWTTYQWRSPGAGRMQR